MGPLDIEEPSSPIRSSYFDAIVYSFPKSIFVGHILCPDNSNSLLNVVDDAEDWNHDRDGDESNHATKEDNQKWFDQRG